MISNTSSIAYSKSYPKHGTNRFFVLKTIEIAGSITNHQIKEVLGWEINRVTGRTNELVKSGLVEAAYEALDPMTGTKATYWKIKN